MQLLERARELPQANDLARLAAARGATSLPDIPRPSSSPACPASRAAPAPRPIRGDRAADALEPLIKPLLVADQPAEAEAIFAARQAD